VYEKEEDACFFLASSFKVNMVEGGAVLPAVVLLLLSEA
jgi:hypothetical protein